jgi:FSR family fosmidomycin resistance protein-like MFS transporter
MTELSQPALANTRSHEWRIVFGISAAHFVSHYYALLLPPLFAFVRADYGVSYTELGFALAAFNVVSATFQTPTGFLVDRLGPRPILIAGLTLGGIAVALAGLVDSFAVFVAMFGLAGLANTVYHPADYSVLSHQISEERASQAYSIHTFAGILGSAVAPSSLLLLHASLGWRGAGLLALQRPAPARAAGSADKPGPEGAEATQVGWRLLLSPPILASLFFFALLSIVNGGFQNYSVVALAALYDTPFTVSNTALTFYLLMSAGGVLLGGLLAARVTSHALVAVAGLVTSGVAAMLVGLIDLGTALLILVMSAGGLASGIIMPSRDMIVRAVTPPGSFGKVFGFVTTGFNISGIISPLIYGALMDHGNPRAVFLLVAMSSIVAILTVLTRPRGADAPGS